MKKKNWYYGLAVFILILTGLVDFQGTVFAKELDSISRARIQQTYDNLPLYFIKNYGQADKEVKFYEKGAGHAAYFTADGVYLQMGVALKNKADASSHVGAILGDDHAQSSFQLVKIFFEGANKSPEIVGEEIQPGKVNYLISNNKDQWRTDVTAYKAVRYKDVYKGIDIKFYGNNRQLEYDIIVAPGADPAQVRFAHEGIDALKIDDDGGLNILLKEGSSLTQKKPYIYQEIDGQRVVVPGTFKLYDRTRYSFELASYNKDYSLIIDPVLAYSTYMGGTAIHQSYPRDGHDYGYSIAIDAEGNAYVTGCTYSDDFPLQNPYQYSVMGARDAFVLKLDASGSNLIYSTYLGGTGWDYGASITVDAAGNAYVIGFTASDNFPTQSPYQGAFAAPGDAFVVKLDASGSNLIYSTYLGGTGWDYGAGITVDAAGNAYLTGTTLADDFPLQNPYQGSKYGDRDAFVAKLNATGSRLLYSTYLGGSGSEESYSIALDADKNAYITGLTESGDFPVQNPYQNSFMGERDAFVAKLDARGSSLVYSTYLGGGNFDYGTAIAVDAAGNAYVAGTTYSADFPLKDSYQGGLAGNGDLFVAKLDVTGAGLVYSTYLGGGGNDYSFGLAIDSVGNAYLTGKTESLNFPIRNPYQRNNAGSLDAFVTKLNSTGAGLVYSTYLGGSGDDYGFGITVDKRGNVYVTGKTDSGDFPTLNPHQAVNAGYYDAFITKITRE